MEKIRSFKDLFAWQKANEVAARVYELTEQFPKSEQFGLTNQIQRAAVSIGSNIAEGFGRNTAKDKKQFYAIAKGSCFETESQLLLAEKLGYTRNTDLKNLYSEMETVTKLISGLMKSSVDR